MRKSLFVGAAVAALAVSGAWMSGASPSHIMLDRTAEPLKSTFNADVGKTRILMLVAPT